MYVFIDISAVLDYRTTALVFLLQFFFCLQKRSVYVNFLYRYQYVFIDISAVLDYRMTTLVLRILFIDLNYSSGIQRILLHCVFCSYI